MNGNKQKKLYDCVEQAPPILQNDTTTSLLLPSDKATIPRHSQLRNACSSSWDELGIFMQEASSAEGGENLHKTNKRSRPRRGKREKRRKQQRQSSALTGTTLCISDLPSGILAHAASFLANPSRALLATALHGLDKIPGEGVTSGNQWDVLEFGEIEKDLAMKLTDDHISAVLLCIEPSKIKKLRLTNLVNITGAGLEPLRGSLTVEQIDFSIVGEYKSPVLDAEGDRINKELPLSCDNVLPILDSIIEREGCALKHLQFPKVWREKCSENGRNSPWESEFYQFLQRYNGMLRSRGRRPCDKCNTDHQYNNGLPQIPTTRGSYCIYMQQHTCYECLSSAALAVLALPSVEACARGTTAKTVDTRHAEIVVKRRFVRAAKCS